MKITDIKITPPLGRINLDWKLMKISTDEGIDGLGEWAPGVAEERFEQLKRDLLGRDPLNINTIHHDLLWGMQGLGAGVEIALWDIKGRKLGVPVHSLIGGRLRGKIRRIAEMADLYHMSIAPHNMASAVTAIAAAHICSTIPNFLALEYHSYNIPLWDKMLCIKNPIQKGYMAVPDAPGLGVDLDEQAVTEYLPGNAPLWS